MFLLVILFLILYNAKNNKKSTSRLITLLHHDFLENTTGSNWCRVLIKKIILYCIGLLKVASTDDWSWIFAKTKCFISCREKRYWGSAVEWKRTCQGQRHETSAKTKSYVAREYTVNRLEKNLLISLPVLYDHLKQISDTLLACHQDEIFKTNKDNRLRNVRKTGNRDGRNGETARGNWEKKRCLI